MEIYNILILIEYCYDLMERFKPPQFITKLGIKMHEKLLNFINKTILPLYDILTQCDMRFNEKNNTYEYYIYYDVDLTFYLRNKLNYEILEKIYKYCEKTNCTDFFNNISVFLVIKYKWKNINII